MTEVLLRLGSHLDGRASPQWRKRLRKECKHCHGQFETNRRKQVYCSKQCRYEVARAVSAAGLDQKGFLGIYLAPSTVGAISEIVACTDLMCKGFAVFRAMSPACTCDLIALRDGKCWRVEVTSAALGRSGTPYKLKGKHDPGKCDIVAYVVLQTREVIYEPKLP